MGTDADEIRLPPLLTPHVIDGEADAFAVACAQAGEGALGAGDAVIVAGTETAEVALVLEPEVAGAIARQMVPLMSVALADAVGALLPPKVAVEHLWPATVLVNGAAGARIRLAMAEVEANEAPPAWLVVAVRVRMALDPDAPEPGALPAITALAEEGGEVTSAALVASLASHALAWLDVWQSDGFAPIERQWLFRAHGRQEAAVFSNGDASVEGFVLGLDEAMGLRLKRSDGSETTLAWPAGARVPPGEVAP